MRARDTQIISGLDAGITAVFGAEALLKIIAFTFTAYIRVNSNKVSAPWPLCTTFTLHALRLRPCWFNHTDCQKRSSCNQTRKIAVSKLMCKAFSAAHSPLHSFTKQDRAAERLLVLVQLDFSIVVVSIIVLALDSLLPGVQWLKGLRVLRALKPLR